MAAQVDEEVETPQDEKHAHEWHNPAEVRE